MSETVIASDGTRLPLSDLPQTLIYSSGQLNYIEVQYPDASGVLQTYKQTYIYTGTTITFITGWIKQ